MILLRFCLISIITCSGTHFSHAQKQKNLNELIDEIELQIGKEWFLQKTENGFSVSFCRSCAGNYSDYLETSTDSILTREYFFQLDKLDSISCGSALNRYTGRTFHTDQERIDYYNDYCKPYSTLQFDVVFENKWSNEHVDSILANNTLLKEAILAEPLYNTDLIIFSDYRYQLPSDYLQKRTTKYDFYFERLPYESRKLDNSLFIIENDTFFFCEPLLVDKNDKQFFEREENFLESERIRVLKVVAKVLKIVDYTELHEPQKWSNIELR